MYLYFIICIVYYFSFLVSLSLFLVIIKGFYHSFIQVHNFAFFSKCCLLGRWFSLPFKVQTFLFVKSVLLTFKKVNFIITIYDIPMDFYDYYFSSQTTIILNNFKNDLICDKTSYSSFFTYFTIYFSEIILYLTYFKLHIFYIT